MAHLTLIRGGRMGPSTDLLGNQIRRATYRLIARLDDEDEQRRWNARIRDESDRDRLLELAVLIRRVLDRQTKRLMQPGDGAA